METSGCRPTPGSAHRKERASPGTSDIVVNPGVVIDIVPGTTVQMATSDAANLGSDLNRVEYMVGGTLQAQGPVTFTSQSNSPNCGDWVGIYFLAQSSGFLQHTTVEYGVHAVEINTTNPITIADSTLRHNCHKPLGPPGDAWGAGLAIYAGTHLVTSTVIYDNIAEAGLPTIPGTRNWAEGAGVEIKPGAGPTLFQNCTIYENQALNFINNPWGDAAGGGVNLDNSNGVIEGDTFIHDNSINALSANGWGGGVSIGEDQMPAPVAPIIRNSRVMTNTLHAGVWGFGGGVGFYGGSWTVAVISGSLIADNSNLGSVAAQGGGIGMDGNATADRFDSNVIRDNLAQGAGSEARGGGICLIAGNPVTVTNNLVLNNQVDARQGVNVTGGGIFANGAAFFLANNTVVSNTAGSDGGGVFWVSGTGSAGYNDVWGNLPNEYAAAGNAAPVTDLTPPADPLFSGAGNLAMRYHLRLGSPCIDTGTGPGIGIPNHDYDGDIRPIAQAHDIGFDELRLSYVYLPLVVRD